MPAARRRRLAAAPPTTVPPPPLPVVPTLCLADGRPPLDHLHRLTDAATAVLTRLTVVATPEGMQRFLSWLALPGVLPSLAELGLDVRVPLQPGLNNKIYDRLSGDWSGPKWIKELQNLMRHTTLQRLSVSMQLVGEPPPPSLRRAHEAVHPWADVDPRQLIAAAA